MKKKDPRKKSEPEQAGIITPAGTEQETGFTRGETEKQTGPVKTPLVRRSGYTEKKRKPGRGKN